MVISVHGFDWTVYAEQVMPAFSQWLINGDEMSIYQLFAQTRCMQEEEFLPDQMQRLRVWPRAQAFMMGLPRGPHSLREYARLCSAEEFTALSDRYLHQHAPQLYQNSDAVRSVWGAIVEEYCLPWCQSANNKGIVLGLHPNMLHLRGWLAGISVRAMVLCEYLACGRRCMPFGYEPGEPFGEFIGYLTPAETWQFATSLSEVKPPSQDEAEEDYQNFCRQQTDQQETFRLVDEVLPVNAGEFLQAVGSAALQGLGLICSAGLFHLSDIPT